jgi:hypothetical protein
LADVGHSPGGCDGGVADSSAVAASDESLTAQSGLTLFAVCRISASDMMFWGYPMISNTEAIHIITGEGFRGREA